MQYQLNLYKVEFCHVNHVEYFIDGRVWPFFKNK